MIGILNGLPASTTIGTFLRSTVGSVWVLPGTRTIAEAFMPSGSLTVYRMIRGFWDVVTVRVLSELTLTPGSSEVTVSSRMSPSLSTSLPRTFTLTVFLPSVRSRSTTSSRATGARLGASFCTLTIRSPSAVPPRPSWIR